MKRQYDTHIHGSYALLSAVT